MKQKILPILILLILTVVTACSGTSSTTPDSGVEGQVVIGPVCPVIQQGGENCIDRPYQATLTINDPNGRKIVQIEADEDGRFKIPLEPGNYILVPESKGLLIPFASQQPFTVAEGKYTQLTIAYDSGIR
jgi:hypothetical protein